jgi:hypothetical protein
VRNFPFAENFLQTVVGTGWSGKIASWGKLVDALIESSRSRRKIVLKGFWRKG